MNKYSYKAIDENGNTLSGNIKADSNAAAASILTSKGLMPLKIKRTAEELGVKLLSERVRNTRKVKTQELLLFTKQLRSMLRAGVAILRLLKVLETQTQSRLLKKVAASLSADIKKGMSLYDSMKKFPKVFSPLYLSMINAGEISGSLPEVLKRLIYIIEHEDKVNKDIKTTLRYPIIVLCFLSAAFLIIITFVIPKFATLFEKAGVALPLPTRVSIGMYHFVSDYWYVCISCVAVSIVVFRILLKDESFRHNVDDLKTKLPMVGPIIIKAAMSRFSSVFSTLLASGISIIGSFDIVANIIGNKAISHAFISIKEKVKEGCGISEPLKSAKYFPPMVVDMIMVGEEGGNLEEMLRDITTHYDEEVQYALKALPETIGPVLIVGLTAMIGFFALAVFLPMWEMTRIQLK